MQFNISVFPNIASTGGRATNSFVILPAQICPLRRQLDRQNSKLTVMILTVMKKITACTYYENALRVSNMYI